MIESFFLFLNLFYVYLRNYLKEKHLDKKNGQQFNLADWNFKQVKDIPQQMNDHDFGMFACKFAEFSSRAKVAFEFNQVILKC